MQYDALPVELVALAERAFELAFAGLADGQHVPSTFVLCDRGGKPVLKRFRARDRAAAFEAAVEYVEDLANQERAPEAAVLAHPQHVTLADGGVDAVAVNVYGEDEEAGYAFARAYRVVDGGLQLAEKTLSLGDVRNALVF